jgi:hypothetical protein
MSTKKKVPFHLLATLSLMGVFILGCRGLLEAAEMGAKTTRHADKAVDAGRAASRAGKTAASASPEVARAISDAPSLSKMLKEVDPLIVVDLAQQINEHKVKEVSQSGLSGTWWTTSIGDEQLVRSARQLGSKTVRKSAGKGSYTVKQELWMDISDLKVRLSCDGAETWTRTHYCYSGLHNCKGSISPSSKKAEALKMFRNSGDCDRIESKSTNRISHRDKDGDVSVEIKSTKTIMIKGRL